MSQDSSLAQLGAEKLQKEFKARVALELLQQTVNRVNAFDTSINTDTGNVSVKPNTDPFNAVGIVSGNIPLLARDFTVTRPDLFLGQGINFAAKLAGLYSPYSYIPGEYFDYPKKRLVNQLIENPVAAVVGSVLGSINKLTSLNIENGSELFLANTSNATSDLLFQQLSYNSFRPDYRLNSLRDPNILAPKPFFYVGDRKTFLKSITPIDQQPVNRFGDNTEAAVFGHAGLGTDYETYKEKSVGKRFLFGLNSRGFYDGANNPNGVDSGTIYGGFTWGSSKSGTVGKKVGYNNEVFENSSIDEGGLLSGLRDTLAGDYNDFRPDSILDVTTKLVQKSEEAKGLYKQRHVGNAISQVSKVFNDGNIELTKGSRVIRYSTPTSVDSQNENDVVGFEYARVFTKDNPYFLYNNLQKTDGNIRKFSNSVLTKTYNLNIAPTMDQDSTSVDWKAKRVKKYMFSLENLAWRTSNRKGYTVEELPVSEIGPNGGRIMWFPPYDLTFDESVKTNWFDHTFLGRTEPVYTYSNTSRSGSLNFKIVVDHPSILNTIVKKELQKTAPDSRLTKVVDSFFAGCTKYDIYELLKRFAEFSISDVYDVIQTLNEKNTIAPNPNEDKKPVTTGSGDFTTYFNKVALYFDSSEIEIDNISYSGVVQNYTTNITNIYPLKSENKIINYESETYSGETDNSLKSDTNFFLQYIDSTNDGIGEFKTFVDSNFTKFGELKTEIKKYLEQKETNELTLELRGNILPYLSGSKNKSIAKDRIKTIEKYFQDDEFLKGKLEKKKFKIKDKTENNPIKILTQESNYDKIDCSRNYKGANNETRTGEFSVNAMACRSVQVTNIITKDGPVKDNNTDSEITSVTPDTKGGEEETKEKETKKTTTEATQPPTRKDIVKRLLRKLLKESDYFEMVRENEPMIYDGIKQKIRHFDPAFHSITPEGLNSRLTFLQQCMRPGDTIPTVKKNDGQTTLDYGDAFNTAFGAPPVCILRIGDFFHTKVIIDSLSISYDEVPFDLNPEGIGVQPMIANVKISFNFIGGQGLKEPVEQLQNALTFNYYGNTEVYDERAVETEAVSEELTAEFIALGQEALGIVTDFSKNNTSDGGATIGKIIDQTVDPNANTITGNIDYKGVFGDFVDTTRNYYESTFNIFEKLTEDYSSAGIALVVKDRTYVEGTFKTNSDVDLKIFGHPIDMQKKVEDLFSGLKNDIDNGTCPLFSNIESQNFKNSDIRDVKRKLIQKTEEKQSQYFNDIKSILKDNPKNEIDLITFIDKFSFINGNVDGFKNKKNTPIIYTLSGATKLQDLKDDLNSIATDINTFYQDLYKYKVIPSGDTEFKSDFNYQTGVVTYDEPNKAPYNRFYLVWGKTVLDGKFNEIITNITNEVSNDDKTKWVEFLNTNIEAEAPYYRGAQQESKLFIDNLKNSENYKTFSSNDYKKDLKNKDRELNYQKQEPTNQTDGNNLIKLYQSVTAPGPKFNLVKQFRG